MKKKVVAIIPARMAASRFPGKPLADILGIPMIEHVRRRVLLSSAVDDVYVATCDQVIVDAVEKCGGKAVMTANTHERCTDRVNEAAAKIDTDIIVIVQGDEPLLDPSIINILIRPMIGDDDILCTNVLSIITEQDDLADIDVVKAVINNNNRVMYYSRAPIPYFRVKNDCPMYRQTGISAFTKTFLHKFSQLSPTPKEIAESVDFLRILENGFPILGILYSERTVGVDRESDVVEVEKILQQDSLQQNLYKKIVAMAENTRKGK